MHSDSIWIDFELHFLNNDAKWCTLTAYETIINYIKIWQQGRQMVHSNGIWNNNELQKKIENKDGT